MYNSKQVEALFEKECVLIGYRDVIPDYIVWEIFGKDAVEFAKRLKTPNENYNSYWIGDFAMDYLTYKGFQIAATFYNVNEYRKVLKGDTKN